MSLKFVKSNDAVSSVIGIVLILGITMISISAMMVYSYPTINELEDNAKALRVEQGLTVLDSRTSKVALGESPTQTTDISIMGGTISVDGNTEDYNESKMVVISTDIDADWYNDFKKVRHQWGSWDNFTNESGFIKSNCSLGSIEYTKNNRKIAYEGGGVWSKYPEGNAIMVSPPEFHYNGETLTLPLMKINGESSVSGSGKVSLSVSSDNMPMVLYPNTTSDNNRTNPLKSDKIFVYIKSKYYKAWADYAESQTYSSATVDDENNTAVIELETIPSQGTSTLTDKFKVGALNTSKDEPMNNFSFYLHAGGAQSSQGLSNLNHNITATSGNKTLTYKLKKDGNWKDPIDLEIIYTDTTPDDTIEERWSSKDGFNTTGQKKNESSYVDLVSNDLMMEYQENTYFTWENDPDDPLSLDNVTQHYMKFITEDGSVIFDIIPKPTSGNSNADPINYDVSTITLGYDSIPGSITYLHVTKNELKADVY
ncbi:MAG: type IV pilin N-terminal domain-containing protein [Methanohalobium sp.]|uniref:type IV pilin N-terminal domain-containing protein n=1 Tax=Methanohalobium sp. TaxID=2837493 RepID=UPI003979508F